MKPMFGPKRFGFGVSPRGWRGWGLTLVVVAAGIAGPRFLSGSWLTWAEVALVGAYLVVVCLTYSRDV